MKVGLRRAIAEHCITVGWTAGRLDNLFFSGGEGIQPEEVERVILRPSTGTAGKLAPLDDAEYGQRPVAVVECDATAVSRERAGGMER